MTDDNEDTIWPLEEGDPKAWYCPHCEAGPMTLDDVVAHDMPGICPDWTENDDKQYD